MSRSLLESHGAILPAAPVQSFTAFVAPGLYATDGAVQRLEQRIEQAGPMRPTALLAELAWYLRERDTQRAETLAGEVLTKGANHPSWHARMRLVLAEADWTFGRNEPAAVHLAAALAAFTQLGDQVGLADTKMHFVLVQNVRGDSEGRDAAALQAIAHARLADDEERQQLYSAHAAFYRCFSDLSDAEAKWGEMMRTMQAHKSPALRASANEFLATVHHFRNNLSVSVKHRMASQDAAMQCGMLRLALRNCSNLACDLENLHAAEEALDWAQCGLQMARQSGWPNAIGVALFRAGEVLISMKQPQRALSLLEEARGVMVGTEESHFFALLTQLLGETELVLGRAAGAREHFERLIEHPIVRKSPVLRGMAHKGLAKSLSAMGQPEAAFKAARLALDFARAPDARVTLIATLMTLAQTCREIAGRECGNGTRTETGNETAETSELYWLQQALQEAQATEGMQVPPELLGALAQAHAGRREFEAAHAFAVKTLAAERQCYTERAANRSLVLEITHRTEQTRLHAEHSQRLMQEQMERAEVQAQTAALLESLGRMGREITAQRDVAKVLATLLHHVGQLLATQSMSVFLLDEDGRTLRRGCGVEDGLPLPARTVPLDDPRAWSARCAREARELMFDADSPEPPDLTPGTLPMQSGLFVPMLAGTELLGVMTLQSPQANAYGEREQRVVRTLAAYGAIAIDNARAYRQLETALQRLHDTEAQLVLRNDELHQTNCALSELSSTDPLTGLRNRRYVEQQLHDDVAQCLAAYEHWLGGGAAAPEMPFRRDLGFFMIDLDHFKQVNDTHGHAAGDRVLAEVRHRLLQVFRDSDYLVRWGGEEFLVVARSLQRDRASRLAERVRLAVVATPFQISDTQSIDCTCSIGFACFPASPLDPAAANWQQVVSRADDALYRAKTGGRNRWEGEA